MTEIFHGAEISLEGKKPRIRGHHLQQYSALVMGMSPKEVAKEVLDSSLKTHFFSRKEKQERVKDQVGHFWQRSRYVNRLTNIFQQFNELLDDSPVELTEGQIDQICTSCAIGNHCTIKIFHEKDDPFADSRFIDSFLEEAKKRAFAVTITTETATYSNAPSEEVRVIETSAGAVREILRTTSGIFAR